MFGNQVFSFTISAYVNQLIEANVLCYENNSLKSCTWKHGCQNHNYVQGGQGVQY